MPSKTYHFISISTMDEPILDLSWNDEEWEYELNENQCHNINSNSKLLDPNENPTDDNKNFDLDCSSFDSLKIIEANVSGFTTEKNSPKEDIAFVVEISWSDNTSHVIKRTYADFCQFHYSLVEDYAKRCEESSIDASSKEVDDATNLLKLGFYLPAHFDRHDGKDSNIILAEKRELQLNKYVQELINLPDQVSACPLVLTFFESRGSDPKPYKDPSNSSLSDQYVLCWL